MTAGGKISSGAVSREQADDFRFQARLCENVGFEKLERNIFCAGLLRLDIRPSDWPENPYIK
ncbi:MAG: hypothetical protein O3C34_07875 [Proteobacteria bacterium]|nr:hypothetical protein [Pseudomonadota bacterium]